MAEPDATQVIAGPGLLYVAPLGTTLPAFDVVTGENPIVWPAGWVAVGYTDAGIDITYTPTLKAITVDEEASPVGDILSAEKFAVAAHLAEATLKNLANAISACTYLDDSAAATVTITQVTVAGATAVYAYSAFTGAGPMVGRSVTITGFVATPGNNVTATVTAFSGGASGTFTVTLTTQANETHAASGAITAKNAIIVSGGSKPISYVMVGVQGPAPGTNLQRVILVQKAIADAAVQLKMTRKDKVVIPVSFDARKISNQPLFQIYDLTANAA